MEQISEDVGEMGRAAPGTAGTNRQNSNDGVRRTAAHAGVWEPLAGCVCLRVCVAWLGIARTQADKINVGGDPQL